MVKTIGKPLAYPIRDAAIAIGIGRTGLYSAIKNGHLTAKKFGRRTIILAKDLERFMEMLPSIKSKSVEP